MKRLRLLAALALAGTARAASAAAAPASAAAATSSTAPATSTAAAVTPAAGAVPAVPATPNGPGTPASPATPANPLAVSLSEPAAGAHLAGTVALTADATPPGLAESVQFRLDGADLGPRLSSRPYTASWNTAGTPDGAHLLTAEVFGKDGRSSSSDGVAVVVDNQPLQISGVSVSGASAGGATVAWTTSKPAACQVEYGQTTAYGASTALESAESVSHSVVLSGLTPGTTYHVRAAAAAGPVRVESDDVSFETPAVSTGGPPPSIAVMNPAPGAYLSGTVNVSVNAAGASPVASVKFMADGSDLGAPVTSPPFVFPWNTATVSDGQHALSAVAADAAGNSATAVVTVNVANAAPVISGIMASAVGGDRADVLWTTDQRADSAVDFGTTTIYGGSTPVGAAQSTGHGVPLRGLLPGTQYHYRAKSRNAAGVQGVSDDQTFTTTSSTPSAAPGIPIPSTSPDLTSVKAPQKFLTPATADGINDQAVFGPGAREVTIFDIRGRKVFHGSSGDPGSPIVWNCKDGSGRVVTAGVYLAKIVARDSSTVYQSFAVAK